MMNAFHTPPRAASSRATGGSGFSTNRCTRCAPFDPSPIGHDPAELGIRFVGCDAEEHQRLGPGIELRERPAHRGHEHRLVGDVMIGGDDHDPRVGIACGDRQRRQQDAGGGAAVARLDDRVARGQARQLVAPPALVVRGDDRHDALARDGARRALQRLAQKRRAPIERAVLLRNGATIATGGQRLQPAPFAGCEHQRPIVPARLGHPRLPRSHVPVAHDRATCPQQP
jgi:hypothetical protein